MQTEPDARLLALHDTSTRDRPLSSVKTPELLRRYAEILSELRARGVVRTNNAPLGDYAEYLALAVYGGELAPNSSKSYDINAADGRRVQVKARTITSSTRPGTVFSVFRSFDFDVASLIVLDGDSYRLRWAREMQPDAIKQLSRWSAHVNGYLLRLTVAEAEGRDITPLYEQHLAAAAE